MNTTTLVDRIRNAEKVLDFHANELRCKADALRFEASRLSEREIARGHLDSRLSDLRAAYTQVRADEAVLSQLHAILDDTSASD